MIKHKLILTILAVLSVSHAATLASFEFATDSTPTSISSNLTATVAFTSEDGSNGSKSTSGTITSTPQNIDSSLGDANISVTSGGLQSVGAGVSFRVPVLKSGSDYQWFSFTFTVQNLVSNELLSLSSLDHDFSGAATNSAGISSYIVTPFGGSAGTEVFSSSYNKATGITFDLTGDSDLSALTNGSIVEFRLYIRDGDTQATATHIIDNVELKGAITVVPEPSSLLLLALGSSSLLLRRRRKAS